MRILFCFIATLICLFCTTLDVQADYCARMAKTNAWDVGEEIPVDCELVLPHILLPIKSIPDFKVLSRSPYHVAESILGPPFHHFGSVFSSSGEYSAFFQEDAPILIDYSETTNLPIRILFGISGNLALNEIPLILKLGPPSKPLDGPVGPFWNDLSGFAQVEVHTPDYKYKGEFIYPVILHVNDARISVEHLEKIKRAKKKAPQ